MAEAAIEVPKLLIAVGVLIVAGFLAHLGFKRWRLPDVLILILLGVLFGPVWHFVDVGVFVAIGPLVGTVAIMVILFDGGLEMRLAELKKGAARGTALALLVFATTATMCAGIAHLLLGLAPSLSILFGIAFGGAGSIVVLPLVQQLRIRSDSFTVAALESAVSDVLVIVGIFALSEALTSDRLAAPGEVAQDLFYVFALPIVVGVAAGFLWARVLGHPVVTGHAYMLTLGVLLLVYMGTDAWLKASGPLAVLAFGIVVGNSRKAHEFVVRTREGKVQKVRTTHEGQAVFGSDLSGFHHEVVFLLRNFFFFGLGVVLDLAVFGDTRFLLVGLLLSAGIAAARYWCVGLLLRRPAFPAWDRAVLALMFPLGLATAALSQVPYQAFGIEAARPFASYATVAIVLTNLFCSVGVYLIGRPGVRERLEADPAAGPKGHTLPRGALRDPVRAPPASPPGAPPL